MGDLVTLTVLTIGLVLGGFILLMATMGNVRGEDIFVLLISVPWWIFLLYWIFIRPWKQRVARPAADAIRAPMPLPATSGGRAWGRSKTDDFLEGIVTLIASAAGLALGGFMLLVFYGVAVLVLRNAFGIQLPNPVDWLPPDWRQKLVK